MLKKVLIVIVLTAILVFVFAMIRFQRGEITEANYARITIGMREKQIESLLGGPATASTGQESILNSFSNDEGMNLSIGDSTSSFKHWEGSNCLIEVEFDKEGVAREARYIKLEPVLEKKMP